MDLPIIEITDRRSVHREPGYISAFARYLGRSAGMTSMAFDLEGRAASGQGCAAYRAVRKPQWLHRMLRRRTRGGRATLRIKGHNLATEMAA
jgi:hypothetical protein